MPVNPPTCRLCNVAHWSTEPHVFPKSAERAVKVQAAAVEKLVLPVPGFDRKAYQREYMRKYMAAKRGKTKA